MTYELPPEELDDCDSLRAAIDLVAGNIAPLATQLEAAQAAAAAEVAALAVEIEAMWLQLVALGQQIAALNPGPERTLLVAQYNALEAQRKGGKHGDTTLLDVRSRFPDPRFEIISSRTTCYSRNWSCFSISIQIIRNGAQTTTFARISTRRHILELVNESVA